MVIANSSGDRVGLSHWEEDFRKHYRDDVYVCVIDAGAVKCAALVRTRSWSAIGGTCPVYQPIVSV